MPSRCSTFQQASGSIAGVRSASPVRRSKQAWCQGTAHGAARRQPVRQRAMIMGALVADREDLRSLAHQQHLFAAHMAQQHGAVGQVGQRHALGQIGAAEFGSSCRHAHVLPPEGPKSIAAAYRALARSHCQGAALAIMPANTGRETMAANAEHERFLTLFQRMVDHTDAWIAKTPPDKLDWVPIQTSAMRFGDRVSRVTIKGLIAHIVVGEDHWAHSLPDHRRRRGDADPAIFRLAGGIRQRRFPARSPIAARPRS